MLPCLFCRVERSIGEGRGEGQYCEKTLTPKGKKRGKNVRQLTKHNVVSWTFNLTATPYPFTFSILRF